MSHGSGGKPERQATGPSRALNLAISQSHNLTAPTFASAITAPSVTLVTMERKQNTQMPIEI